MSNTIFTANSGAQAQGQVLLFSVHEVDLCLDLSQVLKILPLAAWKVVPEGPPYLTGVMNLHGRCVPVIDLSSRLGLDQAGFTMDTPMLWCQSGDVQGVLLVSDIHGVETVVDDDVQMRPLFDEGMAPYLAAMRFPAGPALLLDLQRVLDIAMIADIENMFTDPRKLLEELMKPATGISKAPA